MKCLVTGANGFIGRHLINSLLAAGHEVRAVTSSGGLEAGKSLEVVRIERGALDPALWQAACADVELVFHLAGRAHHGNNATPAERQRYFADNVDLTVALAQAARAAGVKRFIFASSVTVYGASSPPGYAFREDAKPLPLAADAYALSKLAAEEFLLSPEMRDLATTIVRLPLVYGRGVKGNMALLMRLAGLPLPLSGIENRRSFVGIGNCTDFLLAAALHPEAAGRVLLVSDREDVSTPDLLRLIARVLGKKARLFFVPPAFLRALCFLPGLRARYEKMSANFQIDPAASCQLLGWQPKLSLAEGIAAMCATARTV